MNWKRCREFESRLPLHFFNNTLCESKGFVFPRPLKYPTFPVFIEASPRHGHRADEST